MKNVIILTGSPRKKGNSEHIADALERECIKKDLHYERASIYSYFNNDISSLADGFCKSDIVVLICPLYVDSFPYPVIDFLDRLENNTTCKESLKGKRLLLIGQCNFPESRRINPMINSAKIFSQKLDMIWCGSLALGGSIMSIEGKSLEEAGRVGRNMIKGVSLALDDILENRQVSKKAENLFKDDLNRLLFKPMIFFVNKFM